MTGVQRSLGLMPLLCALSCGGAPDESRPSVVLIVVDTLRADAVSVYGSVEGTTPTLDALAAEGLVFRRAFSPSSWTLPAHASLFTGRGIEGHHVGTRGHLALGDDLVTLAERFREADYDTAAFSENMLVSDVFRLLQGFDYKRVTRVFKQGDGVPLDSLWTVDPVIHIREWLEQRDARRPFFLFVNLFDPHSPYSVRDENPWVPTGASPEEMRRYAEKPERLLCDAAPSSRDLEILHGLYLGDVAEADRKLGRILADVHRLGGSDRVITVVTSDHGELFGDRNLLGHEFNLRQGALHVPLVVHGLEAPSAVIDAPVTLVDVAYSILAWAGLDGSPAPEAELDGRMLPAAPGEAPPSRLLTAAYSDAFSVDPEEWGGIIRFLDKDFPRQACGPEDKVFGGMASAIEYPLKYQWYERYPPELYDLSWDPEEMSEQSAHQPEVAARLAARLEGFLEEAGLTGDLVEPAEPLDPEAVEALKALGYAE
jgi:arylsulfatase A-like enzyme